MLAAGLARRGVADAERQARRRYRLGGAAVAASLWLAAAFFFGHLGALALAVALAGVVAVGGGIDSVTLAWLLLFLILPVANALLDWPSWAISRWLGQDLHDLMAGEARSAGRWLRWLFRAFWQPAAFVVHVVGDLVAALLLLLVLAALMPFLVQIVNDLTIWRGGAPPLALDTFLNGAVRAPWPNAFWALSMLVSTLIPTALHAGAVIVTLFLWFLQPSAWRRGIVAGLEVKGRTVKTKAELAWAATRASWLVILTPLVAGILVCVLGWGIVRLIDLFKPVAHLLLWAAWHGIALADQLARSLGWIAP